MAMAHVPPADRGLASGIVNISFQPAAAIGTAVLATVSSDRTHSLLAAGHDAATALVGGYRLAFTIADACVAAGLLLAIVAFATATAKARRGKIR